MTQVGAQHAAPLLFPYTSSCSLSFTSRPRLNARRTWMLFGDAKGVLIELVKQFGDWRLH